jgi:hypothetical protein
VALLGDAIRKARVEVRAAANMLAKDRTNAYPIIPIFHSQPQPEGAWNGMKTQ